MKGKKPNNEFIANFLTTCAQNNQTSPQEIKAEALKQINSILMEISLLKERFSNMKDVLYLLGKTNVDKELLETYAKKR